MTDFYTNPLYQAARNVPAQPAVSPEEEQQGESTLGAIGRGSLNAIAAVGNVLDLPGSMVRDAVSLKNPFDQWMTPFSDENRTTGRDMLRSAGMIDPNFDTWGNFLGGMGVEMLTDPLTPLEGVNVLTRGGASLKAAGGSLSKVREITKRVVDERAKAAGKVAPALTKTGTGYRMTPRSIFEMLPTKEEIRQAALDKLKKNYKPKEGETFDPDNLSPAHKTIIDKEVASALNYEDALDDYRNHYRTKYSKLSDDIEAEIEDSLDKPLKAFMSFRIPFTKTSYIVGGGGTARSVGDVSQSLDDLVAKQKDLPEGPNGEPVITSTPNASPSPKPVKEGKTKYPVVDAASFKQMLDETATSQEESDSLFQIYSARAASAGMSLDDYVGKKIASIEKVNEDRMVGGKNVVRGSFELQEGRAIIKAFNAQNISTLAHETGHLFRRDLEDTPELLKEAEAYVGVQKGEWTRAHEEKFAKAWEKYLQDGKAPTKGLQAVFEKFKDWLLNIYAD